MESLGREGLTKTAIIFFKVINRDRESSWENQFTHHTGAYRQKKTTHQHIKLNIKSNINLTRHYFYGTPQLLLLLLSLYTSNTSIKNWDLISGCDVITQTPNWWKKYIKLFSTSGMIDSVSIYDSLFLYFFRTSMTARGSLRVSPLIPWFENRRNLAHKHFLIIFWESSNPRNHHSASLLMSAQRTANRLQPSRSPSFHSEYFKIVSASSFGTGRRRRLLSFFVVRAGFRLVGALGQSNWWGPHQKMQLRLVLPLP